MCIRDSGGYVVDQLLDQQGFANTVTAKQADLAAFGIRCQQVNDHDAGFQNFGCRFLVLKAGGLAMDGPGTVSYTHLDVYKRQDLCQRQPRWQGSPDPD